MIVTGREGGVCGSDTSRRVRRRISVFQQELETRSWTRCESSTEAGSSHWRISSRPPLKVSRWPVLSTFFSVTSNRPIHIYTVYGKEHPLIFLYISVENV